MFNEEFFVDYFEREHLRKEQEQEAIASSAGAKTGCGVKLKMHKVELVEEAIYHCGVFIREMSDFMLGDTHKLYEATEFYKKYFIRARMMILNDSESTADITFSTFTEQIKEELRSSLINNAVELMDKIEEKLGIIGQWALAATAPMTRDVALETFYILRDYCRPLVSIARQIHYM